jgi:hypothetical protein
MTQIDVDSLDVCVAAKKKFNKMNDKEKKEKSTLQEHILPSHVRYRIVCNHQKELAH